LSELLFVEAVRSQIAALPREETGWLAGLRDPAIGRALSLMHARINEDWTADALARQVNLSRSTFADRFAALPRVMVKSQSQRGTRAAMSAGQSVSGRAAQGGM
jgi:transcriptional regulator GlxA family with amidase domain